MEVFVFGAIVRMLQTTVAAAPTILVGWLVAAVMERILGRDGTLKLFGGHTWKQLPYAWLLGMLLPVCSLGVIPIMVQMRRSGIAGGTILAFGLTAPLFNPISVLYGLTLSDPFALFVFCLCSLTIVTIMGLLWDWLFPRNWLEPQAIPKTPYGIRRIGAVALSIGQQSVSSSSLYILLAILGVGMLSAFLPAGCLQKAAGKDDLAAPLVMAGVATFAYITPMVAIVQVASMFQHGNSIGAAFTLLVLGTGINLGTMAWTVSNYKLRPSLVWLACLILVVLTLGYSVDRPLRPRGVEPADHTHAFDVYCNPFPAGTSGVVYASAIMVRDSWKLEELAATCAGFLFVLVGLIRRRYDPKGMWMQALIAPAENIAGIEREQKPKQGISDFVLPNWMIALSCLGGLVAASVIGCFLYYPPRKTIRQEMQFVQTDLMADTVKYEWDKILYWVPIQEDWAHKLAVSAYLRGTPLNRYQKMKLHVFMSKLELLEHAAEDQEKEEVDKWKWEANTAFTRLKRSLDPE